MNQPKPAIKHELRPISFDSVLHQKTMDYWNLSLAWNSRRKAKLIVQDAINISTDVLMRLNPQRPLFSRMFSLSELVVLYGCKSNMLKELPLEIGNDNEDSKIVVL